MRKQKKKRKKKEKTKKERKMINKDVMEKENEANCQSIHFVYLGRPFLLIDNSITKNIYNHNNFIAIIIMIYMASLIIFN